jgi:hypothetical protein
MRIGRVIRVSMCVAVRCGALAEEGRITWCNIVARSDQHAPERPYSEGSKCFTHFWQIHESVAPGLRL